MSLARRHYYAHPANQFWRLIGGVIGRDLASLDYNARLATLLDAHIGLWDVIGSARRTGSLDTAIRNHSPNALREFAAGLPDLTAIAFNGGTSARIGRKLLSDLGPALIPLPSSSAAYCSISFDTKQEQWVRLRTFLQ